jgi:hydroxymethylglutaryl-CoA reductase
MGPVAVALLFIVFLVIVNGHIRLLTSWLATKEARQAKGLKNKQLQKKTQISTQAAGTQVGT